MDDHTKSALPSSSSSHRDDDVGDVDDDSPLTMTRKQKRKERQRQEKERQEERQEKEKQAKMMVHHETSDEILENIIFFACREHSLIFQKYLFQSRLIINDTRIYLKPSIKSMGYFPHHGDNDPFYKAYQMFGFLIFMIDSEVQAFFKKNGSDDMSMIRTYVAETNDMRVIPIAVETDEKMAIVARHLLWSKAKESIEKVLVSFGNQWLGIISGKISEDNSFSVNYTTRQITFHTYRKQISFIPSQRKRGGGGGGSDEHFPFGILQSILKKFRETFWHSTFTIISFHDDVCTTDNLYHDFKLFVSDQLTRRRIIPRLIGALSYLSTQCSIYDIQTTMLSIACSGNPSLLSYICYEQIMALRLGTLKTKILNDDVLSFIHKKLVMVSK